MTTTDATPEYSAAFLLAIDFTLRHEGGLSDHANDAGGRTNFGLTEKYDNIDPATLTRDRAVAIYHEKYWQPLRADELPAPVAFALFDFAVNSGRPTAVIHLQKIVGAKTDGILGPRTVAAVQAHLDALDLAVRLHRSRVRLLGNLVRLSAVALERGADVHPHRRFYHFTTGWWLRTADLAFHLGATDWEMIGLKFSDWKTGEMNLADPADPADPATGPTAWTLTTDPAEVAPRRAASNLRREYLAAPHAASPAAGAGKVRRSEKS